MVILTDKLLRKGMTKGIGINRDQQMILGVDMQKGWIDSLIGTSLPDDIYNLYVSLKGLKPSKRKKLLKAYDEPITEQEYLNALKVVQKYRKQHGI